jgi:RNA polymerase sigma-70 factor, ECF subfamily
VERSNRRERLARPHERKVSLMQTSVKPDDEGRQADARCGLLDAARRGQDDAFGRLFETFRRHLLILAHREFPHALRGKIGPSDLVQETAVDAHRGIPRFRGSTAEECFGWLRSILRNNLVDAVRRYETTQKRGAGREISLTAGAGGAQRAMAETPRGLPEGAAMLREEADTLAKVLDRLSPDHQTVIRLRYWEGLSFPEIGARLDRSPDAVRKLWYRAVERLKEEMSEESCSSLTDSGPSVAGARDRVPNVAK